MSNQPNGEIGHVRDEAVGAAIQSIRSLMRQHGLDRESLCAVLEIVKDLAGNKHFWHERDFPPPETNTRHNRFLISEDDDKRFCLYLNVMRKGRRIPPHNHTTWACVAAVEGTEHQYLYKRIDDGSVPGKAELFEIDRVPLGPGTGIALMPDDIHSVEIKKDDIIRHLHMYGRSMETMTERVWYDLENGTCTKRAFTPPPTETRYQKEAIVRG